MNVIERFHFWLNPELARFERKLDRQKANLEFQQKLFFRWQTWAAIVVLAGVFGAGLPVLLISTPLGQRLMSGILAGLVIGVLQAGFFFLIFNWLFRGPYRRFLRQRLNELGQPTCLACGYDLRGQVEPRCPECGRGYHREVGE